MDHCFEKDKTKIPFECKTAIMIAKDDPVYGQYNVSLFKFVRSMPSVNFSCPLTPRTIVSIKIAIYSNLRKIFNDKGTILLINTYRYVV